MQLLPRNLEEDRLVSGPLLRYSYLGVCGVGFQGAG